MMREAAAMRSGVSLMVMALVAVVVASARRRVDDDPQQVHRSP